VRSVLETLSDIVGVEVRTNVAAERRRKAEVRTVIGSAEKLHAATDWAPRHEWRDTLETVVEDWRSRG
jgi:nucleoside-diphosphate-sugar epimerase